ncbi:hypothetical protein [Anaeromyxobacter diazotrophicus]|uniref:Transporter n=1 Tax=Anaeromyxobacter diazotrophicus TaxID=2590199 RepID=A0A7I9VM84_9BACT|nr:hypothetical protein [Anaeromyxobacter diazotrophicus]GEJ57250.1 hypothetical protein AMYX_19910 [Anaeromyxobacter diazotrophicus]
MNEKLTVAAVLAAAAVLLAPAAARADRRYYGETYNAVTAPPGGLDVELWSTLTQPKAGSGDRQFWRHQVELETGITPRWDVALYNVFDRVQGETLQYQATKIETRYRLSDYGEWFVDPVLYLEVKKEWTADKPLGFEGKLILGKDVGPLNVSVNALYELELIPGGGREHELGYATGLSYELAPWVRAGGEVFGAWHKADDAGDWASEHYAGPAVSFAWGRTWLVLAGGFGLTDTSQKNQLRAIFALQL